MTRITNPSVKDIKLFGLICISILSIVQAYFYFTSNVFLPGILILIGVIGLLLLVFPRALLLIYIPVYAVSRIIGKINSVILLSIVFFAFITPYRIIYIFMKKSDSKTSKQTHWLEYNLSDSADLKRQF